jgi:hypothetical protein
MRGEAVNIGMQNWSILNNWEVRKSVLNDFQDLGFRKPHFRDVGIVLKFVWETRNWEIASAFQSPESTPAYGLNGISMLHCKCICTRK